MKRLFFLIVFALVVFAETIFACTLVTKPIGKLDETEYVFIGEVAGYTEPVESAKLKSGAYGLIVKVKEQVFLPKTPKTHFEVFPIELWSDCSESGTQIGNLKKHFPLYAEIRVIAKEAGILPNNLADGNIRLEVRPGESSSIVLNYNKKGQRLTSADSVYDYKAFDYERAESGSETGLPNFEVRKDLLRLSRAKNHEEVTKILDKFIYAAPFSDISFSEVLKNYILNEAEYDFYLETELKTNSPESFEQYKAYKGARAELIKAGFTPDAAEKALGKALAEGTKVEKQKLFERSLQILRKN
jgi:hypothetical protein